MYPITKVCEHLWRSPRPAHLQLAKYSVDPGIDQIADCEGDKPDIVAQERIDCYGLHIDVSFFSMGGFFRPKWQMLFEVAAFINLSVLVGLNVLVHCLHGVDRTGMAIAAYRICYQGWTVEAAWQEALDMGMHREYWWWKQSLIEVYNVVYQNSKE
jgi:hypothetical protein